MYATHQRQIAAYGQRSPDNMARVLTFVLLTIRQPLWRVPGDMAGVEAAEAAGEGAPMLYGWKREGFDYVQRHKADLWHSALRIVDVAPDESDATDSLLLHFSQVPGFGMVKAGFVVQLLFGLSGCVDSHNVGRFGLTPADFRSSRMKRLKRPQGRRQRARWYNETVGRLGGTEALWNGWCQHVASQPRYRDAHHVSAIHCEALGIGEKS